jgi:hypothetical protein
MVSSRTVALELGPATVWEGAADRRPVFFAAPLGGPAMVSTEKELKRNMGEEAGGLGAG